MLKRIGLILGVALALTLTVTTSAAATTTRYNNVRISAVRLSDGHLYQKIQRWYAGSWHACLPRRCGHVYLHDGKEYLQKRSNETVLRKQSLKEYDCPATTDPNGPHTMYDQYWAGHPIPIFLQRSLGDGTVTCTLTTTVANMHMGA